MRERMIDKDICPDCRKWKAKREGGEQQKHENTVSGKIYGKNSCFFSKYRGKVYFFLALAVIFYYNKKDHSKL